MSLVGRLLSLLLPVAGSTLAAAGPQGPYGVDVPGGIAAPTRTQYGPLPAQNFLQCVPRPVPDRASTEAGGFAGPYPAVVLVHGGGWDGGDNRIGSKASYSGRWCENFASYGFHAFSVEYRLTPHAPWPAQIADVQAAIRYIRAHAAALGVTSGFVGCMGDSAGGQLCGIAAFSPTNLQADAAEDADQSPQPQAAVLFQGPWTWGPSRPPGTPSVRTADYAASLLAGAVALPPTLFVAGTLDAIVPPCDAAGRPQNGLQGFHELKAAGQVTHFRSFVGGHEFSHVPNGAQPGVWAATVDPVVASEIGLFVEQAHARGLLPLADVGPLAPLDDATPPGCPF